jgi:geranylgeranyl pyrophosphate synthase
MILQVEDAFQYGRNIGIAFQLVDDLLDFEASSALLGIFNLPNLANFKSIILLK